MMAKLIFKSLGLTMDLSVSKFIRTLTPLLFLAMLCWLVVPYAFWNYDEYSAYITVLELSDPDVINRYEFYLESLGIKSATLQSAFFNLFLPLFVVPIRWTYALGISPLYSMTVFPDLTWEIQRLILLAPHLACSFVGTAILCRTLRNSSVEKCSLLLILGTLMLSSPFLYWAATLTSYSYHLLCFALLLGGQTQVKAEPRLFGRSAVYMSLVGLFNYQYLPVIFILGCLDFFRRRRTFFVSGEFKKWCAPAVIAACSVALLFVRAGLGKHSSANFSDLLPSGVLMYSPSFASTSWLNSSDFVLNRFLDVFFYLFIEHEFTKVRSEVYSDIEFGAFIFPIVLLGGLLILGFCRAPVSRALKDVVLVSLLVQLFLYMFGAVAITPSRHALVILLPIVCLLIVTFVSLIQKVSGKLTLHFSTVVPVVLIAVGGCRYEVTNSLLDEKAFISVLESHKVDGVVLAPCALEPLFHEEIRSNYRTVYTCGGEVFREVPDDWSLLAFYSSSPVPSIDEKFIERVDPLLGEGQWNFIHEPLARLCKVDDGIDTAVQCSRRILIFAKEK